MIKLNMKQKMQMVRISDKPEKGLDSVAWLLVLSTRVILTSYPHTVGLICYHLEGRVMG